MLQQGHSEGWARWLRLTAIALLVLSFTIAGSRGLFAQQQNLTVKIDGFKADDWSKTRVIVTVLNGEDKPALGLTEGDFLTEINGTAVPATGLARGVDSDLPASVVLALDVSGGLPSGALDQAKAAANQFIDGLGPKDSVAVLAFSDTANLVQPFTQDRAVAHAALDGLSAGGGDALYQATTQSILLAAASADTGRRAVVLLSAASDNGNDELRQQSLIASKGLGVPVFAIGLGGGIDRQYLRELSAGGGGQFTEAATPEGLIQLYQDVSELLRDQYVLTLDASVLGLRPSDAATLRVTATLNGSSGSDERVVCPQRLCVRLSDVAAGDQIAKARTVTADVISIDPVQSVTFYVDDKKAATVTQPPYQFTLDPKQFSGGQHRLAAEVASATASTRGADVQVRFGGGGSAGSSGSGFIFIGPVVALAVVALLLAAYLWLRRRHGGAEGPRPVSPVGKPKGGPMAKPRIRLRPLEEGEGPPAAVAEAGAPLGRLHVVSGPLAGQTFAVGDTPVSIGSGQRCLIRLPRELEEGGEIAPEFARIWVRGNRLMVHELRRLTAAGPVGGRWEMLEGGDVFSIGPCSFRFALGMEEKEETPEPVPSILRNAPYQAVEASVPVEPIVDILKSHPSNESGHEAEESSQEGPPQAAAAP
jgi:VWFA-related protein